MGECIYILLLTLQSPGGYRASQAGIGLLNDTRERQKPFDSLALAFVGSMI